MSLEVLLFNEVAGNVEITISAKINGDGSLRVDRLEWQRERLGGVPLSDQEQVLLIGLEEKSRLARRIRAVGGKITSNQDLLDWFGSYYFDRNCFDRIKALLDRCGITYLEQDSNSE